MFSRLQMRCGKLHLSCQPSYLPSRWLRRGSRQPFSSSPTSAQDSSMEHSGINTMDDAADEDMYNYKALRWLWNEPEQLQRRYLRFNLMALIQAVEDVAGPGASCIEVTKLPEGNFNKAFLVTMQDQRQLVARLPNPNAGRPHYTTASEVATMDYVRSRLQIPTPKVISYNTQPSDNSVGTEYIIMEKCPGVELSRLWNDMSGKQKIDIVRQLAIFSARMSKARFPYYGSLYYRRDIPAIKGTEIDDTFSVGPTTSRTWFDDKRGEVDVCRGPWSSAEDVLNAIVKREIACLDTFAEFPRYRQQGIFNGPGGFRPSKDSKMAAIRDYSRVLQAIIPKEDAHVASILWHNDLHSGNIFVKEDNPTEITGIIDWQGVHLSPAFLHVHYPSLIEYEGEVLDGFEEPQLPANFAELDPVAKGKARSLHTAQSIWVLYQIYVHEQAPEILRTIRYHDTITCQIMNLIGSIFDDGEAYVQHLLSQLAQPEVWSTAVKTNEKTAAEVPCPLEYSDEELLKQKDDLAKWERSIELKSRIIDEIGAYTGWDGAVSPDKYSAMSEKLEEAKQRFLDTESKTQEEREQWTRAWPFQG